MGAYKALLKEKEVLEKSLLLSASRISTTNTSSKGIIPSNVQPATVFINKEDESSALINDTNMSAEGSASPCSHTDTKAVSQQIVDELESRISNLMDVVNTITQDRTAMTALYVADKRAAAEAQRIAVENMQVLICRMSQSVCIVFLTTPLMLMPCRNP